MIREALAGKRLFLTGSTGFLGTAVLERLLRSVPDCEIVLLVRPGKRSSVDQRVQREILKNDAFDRLRANLGKEGFAEMTARRLRAIPGDVGTDGLGLDDEGRAALASCDTSSTLPPRSLSTPRSTVRSRSTCSARCGSPRRCTTSASRRISSRCRPVMSPAIAVAVRPSSSCDESPVLRRRRLAQGTRRRTTSPPRRRSREPNTREAHRVPQASARRARCARWPAARRQDRAAASALGRRSHGRRRSIACDVARLARCLRLHQGARRARPDRDRDGDVPVTIVRPSIIESVARRATAGLDPRASAWPSR